MRKLVLPARHLALICVAVDADGMQVANVAGTSLSRPGDDQKIGRNKGVCGDSSATNGQTMKAATFNALSVRRINESPESTEIEFFDAKGNVQPIHLSRAGQAQLIRDLLALHSGFTHRDHPLSTIHALSAQPLSPGTDSEVIEFLLGPGLFLRVSLQRESMVALRDCLNQRDEDAE